MDIVRFSDEGRKAMKAFRAHGYSAYLQSDWWKELRRQRLKGLCRGCKKAKARLLHHTHYTHLGREQPWETIPLCHDCHEALHEYLLAQYTDLSRGDSAQYTIEVWKAVFDTPYPTFQLPKDKSKGEAHKRHRKRRRKRKVATIWRRNRSI